MTRQFRFPAFLTMLMGSILSFCQPTLAASGTTTTLVVSPTSAATGSIITMTATVKSGGSPLTSGQMKFCVASAAYCDNGALLGTVWVTSSGTATLRRALPSWSYQRRSGFCAKQFVPSEHFGSNHGHDNRNRSGHEHADVSDRWIERKLYLFRRFQ